VVIKRTVAEMVFWPIHSLLVWIEHIWKFFCKWSVINQDRARFCSFGPVHAYASSPTAHNAFYLQVTFHPNQEGTV
jgi:hypothetical protein